ncbi:MAG: methyltransferase domain-containing protein [Streptosporangiales bacterium]|nr:methyltransferase domain-containing protein [Streptosporangiales bacterium]
MRLSTVAAPTPLQRFFWHLRSLGPRSVLDVGCGRGDLLALCNDEGIEAHGVDRGRHNIEEARARGLHASEGYAEKLALPDRCFDWTVLRNVLHHIPNTEATLREALRVARCGVLIAEPWADLTVSSQRLAHDIDDWSKAVHQALGYYHRPGLTLTEVQAALPEHPAVRATVDYFANLERVSADPIFDRMAEFVSRLPETHPLKDQGENLERRAKENEVSSMGSMTVTVLISAPVQEQHRGSAQSVTIP